MNILMQLTWTAVTLVVLTPPLSHSQDSIHENNTVLLILTSCKRNCLEFNFAAINTTNLPADNLFKFYIKVSSIPLPIYISTSYENIAYLKPLIFAYLEKRDSTASQTEHTSVINNSAPDENVAMESDLFPHDNTTTSAAVCSKLHMDDHSSLPIMAESQQLDVFMYSAPQCNSSRNLLRDFLTSKTYCRRAMYDVSMLETKKIDDIISNPQFADIVVILAAGTRNSFLFHKICQSTPSLYIKLFIVLNEESVTSWNKIAKHGDRLLLLDITDITETRCLSLNQLDESVRVRLQYFSPEWELMRDAGHWSPASGLHLVSQDLWHFDKFYNKVFNITSLYLPVFHYYETDSRGRKQWQGIAVDLLEALAESLNFTYTINEPADRKWGGVNANGTWNGMVSQVKNGLADFAVGKFTVNHIRDTVISFAVPFYFESAVIVMRRPTDDKLTILAKPLSVVVWVGMFVSLLVMGAAVFLVTYLHDDDVTQPCGSGNSAKIYEHFKRAVIWAYGAAMHQSLAWLPSMISMRVLFVTWWFTAIIMIAVYTGNLTAVLAVPRTPSPINTLQELADQTSYKYGVVDSSALHSLYSSEFQDTNHVYKQLYDRSIKDPRNRVTSHEAGIERAKKENYVYVGELTGVTPFVYNDCSLVIGKERFYPSSFAYVFPKNSPYLPIFNKRILQLYDAGVVTYWTKRHYPKDKCAIVQSNDFTQRKASLSDMQGGVVILAAGITVSVLALLTECALVNIFTKTVLLSERS